MGALTFTVPGKPVAWQRARRNGRVYYTAPEVTEAKRKIVLAAKAAGAVPLEGPVLVDLIFDYNTEKTHVAVRSADSDGKDTRPDLDNLVKLVMDALNGVAWRDDGQVSEIDAWKVGRKKARRKRAP